MSLFPRNSRLLQAKRPIPDSPPRLERAYSPPRQQLPESEEEDDEVSEYRDASSNSSSQSNSSSGSSSSAAESGANIPSGGRANQHSASAALLQDFQPHELAAVGQSSRIKPPTKLQQMADAVRAMQHKTKRKAELFPDLDPETVPDSFLESKEDRRLKRKTGPKPVSHPDISEVKSDSNSEVEQELASEGEEYVEIRDDTRRPKAPDASKPRQFTVERILGKKLTGAGWMYHVKWFGYPKSEATWEAADNLDCNAALARFLNKDFKESSAKRRKIRA